MSNKKQRKRIVRSDAGKMMKGGINPPPTTPRPGPPKAQKSITIEIKPVYKDPPAPPPAPVKPQERCDTCKFYLSQKPITGRQANLNGTCRRSHVSQRKNGNEWCGQYKK